MKFEAFQTDLKDAVNILNSVIMTGNKMLPILTHVLIETDGDRLYLYGTNLNQSLSLAIPCEPSEGGAVCVPFDRLSAFVRNLQEGSTVSFSANLDALRITVCSEKSRITLPGLPESDLPKIGSDQASCMMAVNSGDLKEALEVTVPFTAASQDKPIINNIHFQISENDLKLTAIDGHRVAVAALPIVSEVPELPEILLSREAAQSLIRMLPKHGEVDLLHAKNTLTITFDEVTYITRLSDGKYPSLAAYFNMEMASKISVGNSSLKAAVTRTSIALMGADKKTGLPIDLSFEENELRLGCSEGETNTEDSIKAELEGDPPKAVKINYQYLLSVIDASPSKGLEIGLNPEVEAVFFSPQNNSSALFIVTPMRG